MRFERAFQSGRKMLSVYFTAGYPKVGDTLTICRALTRAGVDMIEIGFPFSDPIADGDTIQRSSFEALRNGMTVKRLFEELGGLRQVTDLPVLLMGYLNPMLRFGEAAFVQRAADCGIDGIIIPDMSTREYETKYRDMMSKAGIEPVFLITPRTPEARIRAADSHSKSFLYVVSSDGVTGGASGVSDKVNTFLAKVGEMNLRNPRVVGFGIGDKVSFDRATQHAAGAIVGSAFIRALAPLAEDQDRTSSSDESRVQSVVDKFVRELRGSDR
jgi:tryptophan synthase alpha chain